MQRLSLIINEIYNKFLPLAERGRITLSLDFPDTTQEAADIEAVKAELENSLNSALSRTRQGKITITVRKNQITVTDTGTTLSKPACQLLSNSRIQVKSRVGFGTTATIHLKAPDSTK